MIQQPGGALRARTKAIPVELLDLKLEMGDQRLIVGGIGSGDSEFSFGMNRSGRFDDALIARRDQRRRRPDARGVPVGA